MSLEDRKKLGKESKTKLLQAHIILYDDKFKVLLQHRDKNRKIVNPNTWGLFGGTVELNEMPEQAIRREICEEICYSLQVPQLFHIVKANKIFNYIFIEKCSDKSKIIIREGQRDSNTWHDIDYALNLVNDQGDKKALKKFKCEIIKNKT